MMPDTVHDDTVEQCARVADDPFSKLQPSTLPVRNVGRRAVVKDPWEVSRNLRASLFRLAAYTKMAVIRLRRVARPGSLVFLISDFRGFDEQAWNEVPRLSRHHDVVMIFVHDPVERSLPPPGLYRVSDGENEHELDTFDPSVVGAHGRRFEEHVAVLRGQARAGGAYLITCSTAEVPLQVLQAGLIARRGRA